MAEKEVVDEPRFSERVGREFLSVHIYDAPSDYEQYALERIAQWKDNLSQGDHSPLWLRRTFDMGSEFGAVIDYIGFTKTFEQMSFGFISIDAGSVDTVVPQLDESLGEMIPVQMMSEPYSLMAVAESKRTIEEYYLSQEV